MDGYNGRGIFGAFRTGNVGAHILKLEEAGYIKVTKTFVDRKPRTQLAVTNKGRHKFEEHVAALKAVLNGETGAG